MAKSVEFLIVLRMFCLKLFPSLIRFDEYADRGWEGGRTVVHGFCIWSIGFELFTCRYSWWRCTVEVLTDHGTKSTVCINGYWCENHLIVEKVTDDIIARGCSVICPPPSCVSCRGGSWVLRADHLFGHLSDRIFLRGCDSQHRRTTSTRPTRDDGSHKEERVSSLGYVWTYILTPPHS